MRLSVIIASYNYRDFLGAAISSALAVDWRDKEVIVVDDASTDNSRSVIDGFGDNVAAYFRPKSHQLGTHRFGFEQSSGDVIVFLDADDLLEIEVMREIATVWRVGVSKVQFRMTLIDADGTQLGTAFPQFPVAENPEKLRRSYLRTMAYTTPPGSGNAYSRNFVQNAYAMAPSTMRWSDDLLLILAPILGDVLTIRKPLGRYRIHDANGAAMRSVEAVKLRTRLQQDVEKARLFAAASRQLRLSVPLNPLAHSLHHLQYRLASYLVDPAAHPFPNDTTRSLICCFVSSTINYSQAPLRDRAVLLVWAIGCVLAPRRYRQNLLIWRFAPTSRPAVIRTLLGALSSLRSPRLPDRA